MADRAKQLASKYELCNRYANFGPVIRSVKIDGFRGINNLLINFEYPVSVISGLNSSGKSTVGQICLCGYKRPKDAVDYRKFYVRDFFPASIADPNPFHQNSSIIYNYETEDSLKPQELTISRANSEWSGYKRQPERQCYYAGFSLYIPKVERKDISIYQGSSLTLTHQRSISDEIKQKVSKILNQIYDELHFQGIKHGKRTGELGIASQYGNQYSENNMGFGEGRVLYILDQLENAPMQSLFIIEEPETALHEHAQYELAKYFLDVSYRCGHQIIITTHSDRILSALPSQSRIMLYRDNNGVEVYPGLSSTRIRAFLSLGYTRDLIVFVEDNFAKLLITEMIRRIDNNLLNAIDIVPIGDTRAVINAVKLMHDIGKNAMAVRDADKGEDKVNYVFSFPGSMPPEQDVYMNASVKQLLACDFGICVESIIYLNKITDGHLYTTIFAEAANTDPDYLRAVAVIKYLDDIGVNVYKDLVEEIKNRA
jgi:ABC-type dipeptide/oligopeptide/nickel transport system ATPase subunit